MKIQAHLFNGQNYTIESASKIEHIPGNENVIYAKTKTHKRILLVKSGYELVNQNFFTEIENISFKNKLIIHLTHFKNGYQRVLFNGLGSSFRRSRSKLPEQKNQ